MKRKYVVISVLIMLVIVNFKYVKAEDIVEQVPNLSIVINGKATKTEGVPIIVNSRTLLPLRDILCCLGINSVGFQSIGQRI